MIPKTLIIGLGGTGSDIVVNVYKRFYAHESNNDNRKLVKFLVLDTDQNEIERRREIIGSSNVIQTSSDEQLTISNFLAQIENRSGKPQWFPDHIPELLNMTINDGAGQIRMVSRLALTYAIEQGKLDRLNDVINDLLNVQLGEGNDIHVHIVSTVAGGTGAGSFLQMAYLIREQLINAGLQNPNIFGYFLLGDVLLHDPTINLTDKTKKTNVLANTYASLKELYNIFLIGPGEELPFEYGRSGTDFKITSDSSVPFKQVFLYDFENNHGNNLKYFNNYKKQVEDFLYLNAFSPIGEKTRSERINNIIQELHEGPGARFASAGISRVVFPVENLLEDFAARRLRDNLRSRWLKIDNDFNRLYNEYLEKIRNGVNASKPNLPEFYINNVENLARGEGVDANLFKLIKNSIRIFDQNGNEVGEKHLMWLKEVDKYLKDLVNSQKEIVNHVNLGGSESFLNENDDEQDLTFIRQAEDILRFLEKKVREFINDNKQLAGEEIFLKDFDSKGYYSQIKYRLNTYILERGEELHPIAQRYFLYKVLIALEKKLSELQAQNRDLEKSIESYRTAFNVSPEEGGHPTKVETPLEAYNIILSKKSILFFVKKKSIKEFKEKYVELSGLQASNLVKYAYTKLQEHVYERLKIEIEQLIENLEKVFNAIPDVIRGLENKSRALINETVLENDASVIYVLAEKKYREFLYKNVVIKLDDAFFPKDLSKDIYTELFGRTYEQLKNNRDDKNELNSTIHEIFEKRIINTQKERYKDKFKDEFAGYNVIEAIKKQAEIHNVNSKALIKEILNKARSLATPFGPKFDANATKINSWAYHPDNVRSELLTRQEKMEIFANEGAAHNNASLIESEYYDRTEIIREDSVMVLSLEEHYPKVKDLYYDAYSRRLQEISRNPHIPTPHLDKRWHNPLYMKDIGVSLDEYREKMAQVFAWGLANKYITVTKDNYEKYWHYNAQNINDSRFLKNQNGDKLKARFNNLLQEGLWYNQDIVDEILSLMKKDKGDEKSKWTTKRAAGNASLLRLDTVKNFRDFVFTDDLEEIKGKNLITVFDGKYMPEGTDRFYAGSIIRFIVRYLIYLNGKNEYTKNTLKTLFEDMLAGFDENNADISKEQLNDMINKIINHEIGHA